LCDEAKMPKEKAVREREREIRECPIISRKAALVALNVRGEWSKETRETYFLYPYIEESI